MNVIWLASYPKAGNTWLSTLIYNYVANPEDIADNMQSPNVRDMIPDLHELISKNVGLREDSDATFICKTHFWFSSGAFF